jgi:hypothetical protein
MNTCRNCGAQTNSAYCPDCGTSSVVKRIDGHYVFQELQNEFVHLEHGFLYTAKELLIHPGHTVRKIIEGDRFRHFKPIGFLIICSVTYSFLSHYFGIDTMRGVIDKGYVDKMMQWIADNYNYANIIEIFFIAMTIKWVFRKKGYNYFENLVLLSYLTGFTMLMGCLFILFDFFTKGNTINSIFPGLSFVYVAWGIGQFFNERKWATYLKAFFAYVSGFVLLLTIVTITGLLLNVILKK